MRGELQRLLRNPNALVAVSNGMWAVKLCSNRIVQFLAGGAYCAVAARRCLLSCCVAVWARSGRGWRSEEGVKGKGSPYSITERRVPKLIPVLGSQPTGDVSHKPGGRLPLLFARPAVTRATLKRVGEQRQY